MAGETFSYEDAQPSQGAAFTDTGQPGTAAQQAFYRGLAHGTADYAKAPVGSQQNPYGLRDGEQPPQGAYYVDLNGHLQPPSSAAPQEADTFGYEDATKGLPAPADTRPVSERLGFLEGVTKPLDNVAAWLNNLLPDDGVARALGMPSTNEAIAARKQAFAQAEQTQKPGAIGKFGGEVVGTLPSAMVPGGVLAQGAAAGAALTDSPNDPMAVAKDAGIGAAGGWLGGKLLGALGRAASPKVRPDVQALSDAGVPLTPGQIAGGFAKRTEDAMTSVPVLGDAIRSAQRRGLEGFNRAALNRALDPIGETVPSNVNVGRDGVGFVQDRLGAAYDAIAPQLRADLDVPFVNGVGKVRSDIAPEALDALSTFDRVFKDEVLSRANPATMALDGAAAKQAQEAIGLEIRGMQPGADPKTRAVVRGLKGIQDELQASIERNSPPDVGDRLKSINEGYANFVRAQGAAANAGEKADGLFTPSQLSRSVKTADRSIRKGDYARGDALMQDLAAAGDRVLPSTVPDSGTPLRLLLSELPMLVGFGAESAHFAPKLGGTLLLGGAAGLPYTKLGQPVVSKLMTQRPWTPAQTHAVIEALRPFMADTGAVSFNDTAKRLPQLTAK